MKYQPAEPKDFIKIRDKMPAKYLAFLTPYTASEYSQMTAICYLSENRLSGYAIAKGDLISVFSLPGASQGRAAVLDAIKNGANKLDCLGEFLAGYYGLFGFVEYKRDPWNDEYAPTDWDYEKFGRPDIIYMRL